MSLDRSTEEQRHEQRRIVIGCSGAADRPLLGEHLARRLSDADDIRPHTVEDRCLPRAGSAREDVEVFGTSNVVRHGCSSNA
jgi:hypothetical protein